MSTRPSAPFGEWLKRYRAAAGLTQEALAERAGLSVRGISDLERGRRASPYYDTVRLLADALDLDTDDRANLLAAARGHAFPPDANSAGEDRLTNLPTPLTSLIGRDADRAEVRQLLSHPSVRLLTLTGPGGVGKTRLALAVASDVRGSFPDGVRFVTLAALRDPSLVPATIAHALGLAETADEQPLDRLKAALHTKRLLLALDNFEQVAAAAPVVGDLLGACPGVKALITSRALLRVTGEHEYEVPPLALPSRNVSGDIERLAEIPAAALFLDRLSAVDHRFTLTAIDAPAVAEICLRVDGLPLAIELAAAHARRLTLQELAARLHQRLRLLTHGPRDLPTRQQTLRNAIAWSYDLLAPRERRLLRWLAVFVGGWTLESAEALCQGVDGMPEDVLDALETLVDNSLVRTERGADGRTRYGLLETIREFAEEELAASGEEETARRRHADVTLAFTVRAERGLVSGQRTQWARSAALEVDNVRAALRWSLDHDETERALRIVGNLDWFWDAVGRDSEGWAWCRAALAKENINTRGWSYAMALYAAGELAWNMGEFAPSAQYLGQSIELLRAFDDQRNLGKALVALALTTLYQGDAVAAERHARASIAAFETVDDPWYKALALFVLAEVVIARDARAARDAYERSLAISRPIGDPWIIAHAVAGLGGLAMRERDYSTARTLLEESLALRRSVYSPGALATSLTSLGELARREGDDERALRALNEGLARFREIADAEHIAWTLYNLSLIAVRRGDVDGAASALAECLALRAAQGNPAQIANTLAAVARVAVMRGEAERAARLWNTVERVRAEHGVSAPEDEDGDEERRTQALIREALATPTTPRADGGGDALTLTEAIKLARDILGAGATPRVQ